MNEDFKKKLLDNIDGAKEAITKILEEKGTISDLMEVDQGFVTDSLRYLEMLEGYSEFLQDGPRIVRHYGPHRPPWRSNPRTIYTPPYSRPNYASPISD